MRNEGGDAMPGTALHNAALALATLCALATTEPAAGESFITFQVSGNNTYASAINAGGAVTGSYVDASSISHGYVRAADGAITTFDPQGSQGTFPASINRKGAVTGLYIGPNYHGFLRKPKGKIIAFDPTGSNGTFPSAINDSGVITGSYEDDAGRDHGFMRSSDGTITTFDPSGSIDSEPTDIN